MHIKRIIQKIIPGVLLLLFAFSITPKQFLHDAIAKHKHSKVSANSSSSQQLDNAGFKCDCDNLVVESPFVQTAGINYSFTKPVFQESFPYCPDTYISRLSILTHLRGPPVC